MICGLDLQWVQEGANELRVLERKRGESGRAWQGRPRAQGLQKRCVLLRARIAGEGELPANPRAPVRGRNVLECTENLNRQMWKPHATSHARESYPGEVFGLG